MPTIEQEMITKTLEKGYRLAEVPTLECGRQTGDSVVNLHDVRLPFVFPRLTHLYS